MGTLAMVLASSARISREGQYAEECRWPAKSSCAKLPPLASTVVAALLLMLRVTYRSARPHPKCLAALLGRSVKFGSVTLRAPRDENIPGGTHRTERLMRVHLERPRWGFRAGAFCDHPRAARRVSLLAEFYRKPSLPNSNHSWGFGGYVFLYFPRR